MSKRTGKRNIGEYVVVKRIGSGSFATVWLCRGPDGQPVAIKSISRDKIRRNKKHETNLLNEIDVMTKLKHANIVNLLGNISTERHIYLVLEYCPGGDLSVLIRNKGPLSEEFARHLLRQLAQGLRFMRGYDMVHRDLKPQNLLLMGDSTNTALKIADFGFARSLQDVDLAATLCGSPLYMAPEILKYQKYDVKADLWSVGAILFEMVIGRTPFTGANHVQLIQRIESSELKIPASAVLSPHCVSLLQSLLKRNPMERLSWDEFFSHPFFGDPIELPITTTPPQNPIEAPTAAVSAPSDSPPRMGGSKLISGSPTTTPPFSFTAPQSSRLISSSPHITPQTRPSEGVRPFTSMPGSLQPLPVVFHTQREQTEGGSTRQISPHSRDGMRASKQTDSSLMGERKWTQPAFLPDVLPVGLPDHSPPDPRDSLRASPSPSGPDHLSMSLTPVRLPAPETRMVVPERVEKVASVEKEYVVIGPPPEPVAELSPPPSQVEFDIEPIPFEELEDLSKKALLVARYADDMYKTNLDAALALYVKALQIFRTVLAAANQHRLQMKQPPREEEASVRSTTLDVLRFANNNNQFASAVRTGQLDDIVRRVSSHTQTYYARAASVVEHITESSLNTFVVCVEKLLFDFALQLSKEAAVDEMYGKSPWALKKYTQAYSLLELVEAEVRLNPGNEAQKRQLEDDLEILADCMGQLYERMQHAKTK